jgi:hypothetical protein
MNYGDIREVIKWICKRTDKEWLESHLNNKFDRNYAIGTCYGVMSGFYCDIDKDLQDALVEYALTVYAPRSMKRALEKNDELYNDVCKVLA